MARYHQTGGNRFRVWIVAYEGPAPADWNAVPPALVPWNRPSRP